MQSKAQAFTNFSRAIHTTASCYRPDNEDQLNAIVAKHPGERLLARGRGFSYSDCCVNDKGIIIDTARLNHILSFDATTGLAVCQGAVVFSDLFLLHPQFIPPILPGTLYATIAGGVANDVHGKNNPHAGNLGDHIEWLELQIGKESLRCSKIEHPDLFKATIAGLGLTGIIKRIALRLRKASCHVAKKTERFTSFTGLLQHMQREGIHNDYQVAWLDLLNKPRALLSLANHVESDNPLQLKRMPHQAYSVPKLPFRIISHGLMKQLNRAYYQHTRLETQIEPLWKFNNPLDAVKNFNHVYGKKGLLQFQAVFDSNHAEQTLDALLALIQSHKASPTLAVLKYFTQPGQGMLSFAEPGFTLAIDFLHNQPARQAIAAMNECITRIGGKIYLAKDLLLTPPQFITMYPQHEEFCDVLASYNCPMRSDLGKRLGITT